MCNMLVVIKNGARHAATLNKVATGYYEGSYALPTRVGVVRCKLKPLSTGRQFRQTKAEWTLDAQPVTFHRLEKLLGVM